MTCLPLPRLLSCAAVLVLLAAPAQGQLRLPSLPGTSTVPSATSLPVPGVAMASPVTSLIDSELAPRELTGLRQQLQRELRRRYPRRLDTDPAGHLAVRAEVLAEAPEPAALDALRANGFTVLRERVLDGLDLRLLVLQAPPRLSTAEAVARARELDPQGRYDFNHVLGGSGPLATAASAPASPAPAPSSASAPQDLHPTWRVGLVDGGIEARHPALRAMHWQAHGCDGTPVPSAHGTAVASLLVGRAAGFQGAAPGAALYAADVFCGQPTGGAIDAVAEALGWLARERVPVINISLVGPPNRLLERVIAALLAKGHAVVAAVGNDGPAAPPLYPAAYPGVIGVTGVDARRRILPEAAQGPQVMLAAPGSDMAVADGEGGFGPARGTSFAAPLVAGLLAQRLAAASPSARDAAVASLAATGLDLGTPGRDPVFGFGLVGESLRADPRMARR